MEAFNIETIFDEDIPFAKRRSEVLGYQVDQNQFYGSFYNQLSYQSSELPLIPIQLFREKEVYSGKLKPTLYFESSGTAGMKRSRHYVNDQDVYQRSILEGFKHFYGDNYVIWAYTPGYNDNPNSSLIWMLNELISKEESGLSRFLPLDQALPKFENKEKRLMLFGAAFGLMDLAENHPVQLPEETIIMETGGMKTHRREISRDEMHKSLAAAFGLHEHNIHSEYGMTELLSQAYSLGDQWFVSPHWMQISIRNPENPLEEVPKGEEGIIGVIDLANVYSCPFLLTGDKGIQRVDGAFQVLGRWKPANLRGCNFLIDQD